MLICDSILYLLLFQCLIFVDTNLYLHICGIIAHISGGPSIFLTFSDYADGHDPPLRKLEKIITPCFDSLKFLEIPIDLLPGLFHCSCTTLYNLYLPFWSIQLQFASPQTEFKCQESVGFLTSSDKDMDGSFPPFVTVGGFGP